MPLPEVVYRPIGIIESPFTEPAGMPIQPTGEGAARGRAVLDLEYAPGLADLSGFSHVILLYHFHRSPGPRLTVVPFLDDTPRGVFATRAPARPNPLGLSVVRLVSVTGNVLELDGVDILDGTPLLDVKPYVPAFDSRPDAACGWLEKSLEKARTRRADDRFIGQGEEVEG
ncbi:MAG: tRNA (N6-threonylcarbamoyladenosine(37)-N6)-methyltransferase TrmO [Proteobacteria bacterium]|nr:tRNA (N6-threonylcarbamoyladenosine(37)-N6)-methyltransferase TrmO [Pseudomonadota bacterium]